METEVEPCQCVYPDKCFCPVELKPHVVVVFDAYDEDTISFTLGPYATLADAQKAWREAEPKIQGEHRQRSIQQCVGIGDIPDWELQP